MTHVDRTEFLTDALARARGLLSPDPVSALDQVEAILADHPGQPDALWLKVRALEAMARTIEAIRESTKAVAASLRSPEINAAARALGRGQISDAERLVRAYLQQSAEDILALLMLADIASRVGIYREAEQILRAARNLVPSYPDASINLAMVLFQQGKVASSLEQLNETLALAPDHGRALASKANILAQIGEYHAAAKCYRLLLDQQPGNAEAWLWYGNVLKTIGNQPGSRKAYRRAIELDANLAEAWWSLSELKGNDLGQEDLVAITVQVRATRSPEKLVFFHFALGQGYERHEEWQRSFEHYREANRLRLSMVPHDRAAVSIEVNQSLAMFNRVFFAARTDDQAVDQTPIFIVGMPRAGSTLVEQILASHSLIEGTSELPHIPQLVRSTVAKDWANRGAAYPESLMTLTSVEIEALRKRYLEAAAEHRKSSSPWFIDKLPNNWRYIGFIRLILPNAKIIDARRNAMACCFSNFKQHFTQGQSFAYSFEDLA
ncbi:MAG: sulfotransferase, partial [Sphingomonas sp.]